MVPQSLKKFFENVGIKSNNPIILDLNGKNLQFKIGKINFQIFQLIYGKTGRARTTGESLGL